MSQSVQLMTAPSTSSKWRSSEQGRCRLSHNPCSEVAVLNLLIHWRLNTIIKLIVCVSAMLARI